MKKVFHTTSKKESGQTEPVRTLTMPNGTEARILRRDIYERALDKAAQVIKEKAQDYDNPTL